MRRILGAERFERTEQVQDADDQRHDALAERQLVRFGDEQMDVVVVLDAQRPRGDEHHAADGGEQDVDAPIQRRGQRLGCATQRGRG